MMLLIDEEAATVNHKPHARCHLDSLVGHSGVLRQNGDAALLLETTWLVDVGLKAEFKLLVRLAPRDHVEMEVIPYPILNTSTSAY